MSEDLSNETSSINPWKLTYDDFQPDLEKSRESLLAIGNGYLGSRGALEECKAGDIHYPGTYIAGLYNRLVSQVADKDIENEDFVNCPNWHLIRFRIDGGNWIEINAVTIEAIHRELNLQTAVLTRDIVVKDESGRKTRIISRRTSSMAKPHLLVMEYNLEPVNYSGKIELESTLDGTIKNDGVARYRELNQQHLEPVEEGYSGNESWISVKTTRSGIEIAEASRTSIMINNVPAGIPLLHFAGPGSVRTACSVKLARGEKLNLEKIVAIYTSKPDDADQALFEARDDIRNAGTAVQILEESALAWKNIWDKIDIRIEGDPKSQLLIRLHLYHLMVSASPHNESIDAGIAARGLHGEAYRGHIFWDELYILPLYNLFLPEVAKSILKYRFNRLDQARKYAKQHSYKGAMFPWQSGSSGREETQVLHLNPVSGKWGDDYSSLQRHISIAIAYNIWYYFQVTEDIDFMNNYGAEIFMEICRFWASKSILNEETGRYSISKVMGPDEFHELHPKSPDGGVKDNAYTNIMVAWLFYRAADFWEILTQEVRQSLGDKIDLNDEEIKIWSQIARKLNLEISQEGIISQFDGYFDLEELDWAAYRKKYKNIYRLDRILKAEGRSPDDYKLAKQADTLMTYYNLDDSVIREILGKMSYVLGDNALKNNFDYYINRTSHGSTLSRVVHAYLANQLDDKDLGWELYSEALASDYTDIQGGTTAEGIHAGVMGGTVLMAITSFTGLNLKHNNLKIDPHLPAQWSNIQFQFDFKACHYKLSCSRDEIKLEIESEEKDKVELELCGKKIVLQTNKSHVLNY